MTDESVRRYENKMEQVTEVFPVADSVIRPASIKTANEVLRRPAVELAPVFSDCVGDGNRAGDVGVNGLGDNRTSKLVSFLRSGAKFPEKLDVNKIFYKTNKLVCYLSIGFCRWASSQRCYSPTSIQNGRKTMYFYAFSQSIIHVFYLFP